MSVDSNELMPTVHDSEPVGAEPFLTKQDVAGSAVKAQAEPVAVAERVDAVDVLRGFALLGILAVNIGGFAWPEAASENPLRGGGFEGADRVVWVVTHLVFAMKMMTIFSMLFGAGLVLMDHRAEKRGASLRGVYYRRISWLLVIGLIHSYAIWAGDILVWYAECGFLIYLFRRLGPKTLMALGLAFMMLLVPFVLAASAGYHFVKGTAAEAIAAQKAGKKPTKFQAWMEEVWTEQFVPAITLDSPTQKAEFERELKTYRGDYLGIVKSRSKQLVWVQILGFALSGFWMVGGRMLLGMGLMKMDVFSGTRSRRFYVGLTGLGYGLGVPLVAYDAYASIVHRFGIDYVLNGGFFLNFFGSVAVALGHVGALMLVYQAGRFAWLTTRLAAVGRMALTNYLMHSIVCTTLFYGYGFGRFGHFNRTTLAAVVFVIWVAQLLISPIWLRVFRFGPAEWVWRSLTYWRVQPILFRGA